MSHHSTLNPTGWFSKILQTNHIGAIFALVISFTLTACGGGEDPTDIGPEPGADGTAPTLTSVTLKTQESGLQYAELGQTVVVNFTASESLMKPTVTINGEAAEVSGQHNTWSGERVMTADDADGNVTFEITFTDVSGVAGTAVTTSTLASNDDGSLADGWASIEYCADGSCVVVPVEEKTLDFEDNLLTFNWKDIGSPAGDVDPGTLSELVADPDDATNTVAKSSIEAGGQAWAGAYLVVGETDAPEFSVFLSELDPVISIKVRPDAVGTEVQLKLELATDNSKNVVAKATTTVADEWETLYFDFSDPVDGSIDPSVEYGAFFMIWGGITAGKPAATWYWDDITHGGVEAPDVAPGATIAIPVNFEAAAADYNLVPFDGGSAEILANPDKTGENTSNNVLKYVKDAGQTWGGFSLNLDTAIDFNAGEVFTVKVWSSAAKPLLLKLDGTNVEKTVTTAGGSAWETLTFDFSGTVWGAEDKKLTIIADNGVMGDGSADYTFYIDDINLGGAPIGLPVNFEADAYSLVPFDGGSAEVIANPDSSGENTSSNVLKYVKEAGQTWGGFSLNLDTAIDTTAGDYFKVKVWSSAAKPLLLKFDGTNVEKTLTTAGGSAWETLHFDFSGTVWGAEDKKITIIADNGTMGDGSADFTFYLDDIEQTTEAPPVLIGLPLDFEEDSYSLVPFDGGSAEVVANPDSAGINTSANVLKYIKSAGQTWGGFSINLDTAVDTAASDTYTLKVWSSAAKPLLLKFDGTNAEQTVNTAGGSAWETLTFDFSGTAWGAEDKKITIIAENGVMGDGSADFTFYIDDIAQQ